MNSQWNDDRDSQYGSGPQWGNSGSQYGGSSSGRGNSGTGTQWGNSGSGSQYGGGNYGSGSQWGNSGRDTQSGTGTYESGSRWGRSGSTQWGKGGNDSDQDTMHKGKGPKGYKRADERIQDDINDRLTDDSQLDASEIEVTVTNGEVKLSGTVDSRDAKRRAEDLTEAISGVSNVENSIRVKQDKEMGSSTSDKSATSGSSTGSSSTDKNHNGHDKNKTKSTM